MGPFHLMVNRLADIMKQTGPLGHFHINAQFCGHNATEKSHLQGVLENVLQHSLEVAFLCGIMAAELGIDVKMAKRAGLLHDIGKAVDHEVEGSHAIIGRDLAKKYGEPEEVVYAIGAHHEDLPPQSVLDILVQSADALSGARPGARKEMLQTYVKRLEDLENIANAFDGVEKSYAIQAGRDLRIIVDSKKIKDSDAI